MWAHVPSSVLCIDKSLFMRKLPISLSFLKSQSSPCLLHFPFSTFLAVSLSMSTHKQVYGYLSYFYLVIGVTSDRLFVPWFTMAWDSLRYLGCFGLERAIWSYFHEKFSGDLGLILSPKWPGVTSKSFSATKTMVENP